MSKIDLNLNEVVTIIWRTIITLLLTANLIIAVTTNKQVIASTDAIINKAQDTYDAVIEQSNSQPEIPDESNEDYQANCPPQDSILDDPGKVLAFFDAVDSYIEDKPYRLNLLIAMLISEKQDITDYLSTEYSTGFPNP